MNTLPTNDPRPIVLLVAAAFPKVKMTGRSLSAISFSLIKEYCESLIVNTDYIPIINPEPQSAARSCCTTIRTSSYEPLVTAELNQHHG